MSAYPPPPLSRQQEKAELQHLGDRVQNYIGKNRKLREDVNNVSALFENDKANTVVYLPFLLTTLFFYASRIGGRLQGCTKHLPGGYSDLSWTGVCCSSLKTHTHL